MIIDKQLCNRILESLTEDYPSNMSRESWSKATTGETDIKRVSAQFKYLEEKGFIDTEIREDEDRNGAIIFNVVLEHTRITAHGIDFISEGGFSSNLF